MLIVLKYVIIKYFASSGTVSYDFIHTKIAVLHENRILLNMRYYNNSDSRSSPIKVYSWVFGKIKD